MSRDIIVDCAAGRELGCGTFCCRLVVRLAGNERDPDNPRKNCVDKDPGDGLCVHFDRQSQRCAIWSRRPTVCRSYDCNDDPLLQTVLCYGFRSLSALVTCDPPPPGTPRMTVPYLDGDPSAG